MSHFRGSGVILVRAFPTNAATFLAYEYTMRGLVSLDLLLGREVGHHHPC